MLAGERGHLLANGVQTPAGVVCFTRAMAEYTRCPEPTAELEQILRFALTYHGYRRLAHDPNRLYGIVSPVLEDMNSGRGIPDWAGLDLLRGALFYLQRSAHHVGHVSGDDERQMRTLAAAIGRLARNAPLVADDVV